MILKSPAKLNLYLKVLAKRKDNYHNIETIFERIALFDTLFFKTRSDGKIKVSCSNKKIPVGKGNIVYRAAALLQKKFKVKRGIEIRIVKRIPVAAGLAGGSSNAAYTLLGLNRLWGLKLKKERLIVIAKALGSDVAFFIYNCSFARGKGRGEKITALGGLKRVKFWHILAVPKLQVLTPLIYKKWDKNVGTFKLTKAGPGVKILTSALIKNDLSLISLGLYNNLEKITFKAYPIVKRLREELVKLGLKAILMSGSGPAVFGIVSSRKEAVSLCGRLKDQHRSWQVFAVRTF